MPPAATVGSNTSHGTPLSPGPGSPNVLIGGLPAWRATWLDNHICPLVDGNKPHVGGWVQVGSMTVLINDFPAARMGDSVIEIGTTVPNTIMSGISTVSIE